MLVYQPLLEAHLTELRAKLATQVERPWLPDAIEVLILACLARIFDRLDRLIALWRAGALPAFPPAGTALNRPTTPHLRTTHPRTRAHSSTQRHPLRQDCAATPNSARSSSRRTIIGPPRPIPPPLPRTLTSPRVRPRSARAPPPPHAPIRRENPWRGAAQPRLISYEYVIK